MDCKREPSPTKRGDKQAPATVRRDRNKGRLVISLEVEFSEKGMAQAPKQDRTAIALLRAMTPIIQDEVQSSCNGLLAKHDFGDILSVTEVKVEAAP